MDLKDISIRARRAQEEGWRVIILGPSYRLSCLASCIPAQAILYLYGMKGEQRRAKVETWLQQADTRILLYTPAAVRLDVHRLAQIPQPVAVVSLLDDVADTVRIARKMAARGKIPTFKIIDSSGTWTWEPPQKAPPPPEEQISLPWKGE